jgi:hypothetical protein
MITVALETHNSRWVMARFKAWTVNSSQDSKSAFNKEVGTAIPCWECLVSR